ncbi:sugar phosphate isomerase/epimerase family protein [Leifsonia sp. NPDC058248]|uniref:sugar phosphate isomerase/epimerase family protein n=1 Tax=Leifsonia sp. NPDC058248 TaxID=3346402 RepID=UPI0036DBAEC8
MCNELFDDRSLVDGFRAIASAGYEAVELAPFTLGRPVEDVRAAERAKIRRTAASLGLDFTGLHWLLAKTEGMHIAAIDPEARQRTLDRLKALTDLCTDLGGHVLVFGSPQQRSTPAGMTAPDGRARSIDLFRSWAVHAEQTGTTICLEALPADETDFMNTTDEVIEIVRAVDSSAVQLVLDVKSMSAEDSPIPDQIARAAPWLAYVQANDADRGGPGFGKTDFVPIFRALADVGYDGDVSVEAFEVATDVDDLARRSFEYLSRCAIDLA